MTGTRIRRGHDARVHRAVGAAVGVAAVLLVEAGLIDTLRGQPGGPGWQLDELFFALLMALVGTLLAERATHRRVCREVERRVAEEQTARDLALRDPLTGLLNRRGLEELAKRPVAGDGVRQLFLADLDHFKEVNDTHGHAVGDQVLRRFAAQMRAVAGVAATVEAARLGGDEFIVVVEAADEAAVDALAAHIGRPVTLAPRPDETLTIAISVGTTRWPAELALEAALEQADMAMYEAKRLGIGRCRFDRLFGEIAAGQPVQRVFERQLTGLPQRDAPLCVAAISLDRYHNARRTLGYGFAARLLRAVRERLEAHRPALVLERLGPDTLGVLFPADDVAQAMAVIETLNALSAPSYLLDGVEIESPLTIGIAGPAPAEALRETVEQAQFALDEARRAGKRQVVFDLREQHRAAQNARLMDELRQAIAGDGLELHYQPKLSARTGEIDSVEALVRWPHAERGPVSPGEFVPIAEESGDVKALTYWVIDRALADWDALAEVGLQRPIYVNVSAQLVGDEAFARHLLERLTRRPGQIGIEITETAVLENPDRALGHLRMLADAGIKIAIDDYGVGLSSLSYLKQLPATELKIDMMFITDLADSHRDPMIVRSTIDLAHGLGLRVTAEGVDKPESMALLRIMGCDMIQGFQISPALPRTQLVRFLLDHDAGASQAPMGAAQLLAFARAE